MLHDVHHEQGIAVGALVHQRDEAAVATGPGSRPARYAATSSAGKSSSGSSANLPTPPQLLHHAVQRVRMEHHVHRAIRPQHQEPSGLAPLCQGGQEAPPWRGHSTAGLPAPAPAACRPPACRGPGRSSRCMRAGVTPATWRCSRSSSVSLSPALAVAPATGGHSAAARPGKRVLRRAVRQLPHAPLRTAGTVRPPHSARRTAPARSARPLAAAQRASKRSTTVVLPIPTSPLTKTTWRVPWAARWNHASSPRDVPACRPTMGPAVSGGGSCLLPPMRNQYPCWATVSRYCGAPAASPSAARISRTDTRRTRVAHVRTAPDMLAQLRFVWGHQAARMGDPDSATPPTTAAARQS